MTGVPHICRLVASGSFRSCTYMAMQLLGQNLSELRRSQPDGTFSVTTTALLGLQMLEAIESVHAHGYLHRDIKPVRRGHSFPPPKIIRRC